MHIMAIMGRVGSDWVGWPGSGLVWWTVWRVSYKKGEPRQISATRTQRVLYKPHDMLYGHVIKLPENVVKTFLKCRVCDKLIYMVASGSRSPVPLVWDVAVPRVRHSCATYYLHIPKNRKMKGFVLPMANTKLFIGRPTSPASKDNQASCWSRMERIDVLSRLSNDN